MESVHRDVLGNRWQERPVQPTVTEAMHQEQRVRLRVRRGKLHNLGTRRDRHARGPTGSWADELQPAERTAGWEEAITWDQIHHPAARQHKGIETSGKRQRFHSVHTHMDLFFRRLTLRLSKALESTYSIHRSVVREQARLPRAATDAASTSFANTTNVEGNLHSDRLRNKTSKQQIFVWIEPELEPLLLPWADANGLFQWQIKRFISVTDLTFQISREMFLPA